jgi:hypothetical protein
MGKLNVPGEQVVWDCVTVKKVSDRKRMVIKEENVGNILNR